MDWGRWLQDTVQDLLDLLARIAVAVERIAAERHE